MANRVALGNANGEYGLYVSQKGDNVLNPSKQLSFDSRAFNGLSVHAFGEGTINAPSGGSTVRSTSALGYTNLGFSPLFALRYSFAGEISSGKATKVRSPSIFGGVEDVQDFNGQTEEETVYTETKSGGASATAGASSIVIRNHYGGKTVVVSQGSGPSQVTNQNAQAIKYAYIIFGVEDFTGGQGI
tara:strand:- start:257 stop:817 length:561 start_codon:yes stop_codon:yes gene_type:complete